MNNPYSPPGIQSGYTPDVPGSPYGSSSAAAVSDLTIQHLRHTRPWVMLLSIVSIVASAFMLLAGLGLAITEVFHETTKLPMWLGFLYIPFAGMYVYPAIKLWTYSSAIGRLLVSRATGDLEAALGQQKSLWKYLGISTIVVIVVYIAVLVGAAFLGFAKATHHARGG
jgi:hypothetical membrane protein